MTTMISNMPLNRQFRGKFCIYSGPMMKSGILNNKWLEMLFKLKLLSQKEPLGIDI